MDQKPLIAVWRQNPRDSWCDLAAIITGSQVPFYAEVVAGEMKSTVVLDVARKLGLPIERCVI